MAASAFRFAQARRLSGSRDPRRRPLARLRLALLTNLHFDRVWACETAPPSSAARA